jgi:hypothetical protein
LGERLLCKQEVVGSIPSSSTSQVPVVSWQLTVKAAKRAAVLLATDYCQLPTETYRLQRKLSSWPSVALTVTTKC